MRQTILMNRAKFDERERGETFSIRRMDLIHAQRLATVSLQLENTLKATTNSKKAL